MKSFALFTALHCLLLLVAANKEAAPYQAVMFYYAYLLDAEASTKQPGYTRIMARQFDAQNVCDFSTFVNELLANEHDEDAISAAIFKTKTPGLDQVKALAAIPYPFDFDGLFDTLKLVNTKQKGMVPLISRTTNAVQNARAVLGEVPNLQTFRKYFSEVQKIRANQNLGYLSSYLTSEKWIVKSKEVEALDGTKYVLFDSAETLKATLASQTSPGKTLADLEKKFNKDFKAYNMKNRQDKVHVNVVNALQNGSSRLKSSSSCN